MNGEMFSLLIIAIFPILLVSPVYAQSGFLATSTNSTSTTKSTDPNYNIYQNLALGFSIKYIKNMTISQIDSRESYYMAHDIYFQSPHRDSANFKGISHLLMVQILMIPSTDRYGLQIGLDSYVNHMLTVLANNMTTVTSKSSGSLNGFPAYRIEYDIMDNPANYTGTTEKVPFHGIMYLTVKGQTTYELIFYTIDKNPQTYFIPIVNKLVGSFQYN